MAHENGTVGGHPVVIAQVEYSGEDVVEVVGVAGGGLRLVRVRREAVV